LQNQTIMLRICTLWLTICWSFASPLSAQVIRVGITKTDLSQLDLKKSSLMDLFMIDLASPNALNTISDKLVSVYTNDPGFKVIDFRSYDLVKSELERQKSESFIDGFIVEQGRVEGANYILSPIFLATDNEIAIRVFDVEKGNLVCSASTPLVKNKTGVEYTRLYTAQLIQQLNNRCFNLQYPVVRSVKDKGDDSKELLIAYGHAQQAKEKQFLGIFVTRVETVNGQEMERQEQIGDGEISEVEDDNFSVLEVRKGGTEIYKALQAQQTLFIRTLDIKK
jgi:hypothetical protein